MTDLQKELTRHESIAPERVDAAKINAALLFEQVSYLQQELGQWKDYAQDLERKNAALNELNNSFLSYIGVLQAVLYFLYPSRNYSAIISQFQIEEVVLVSFRIGRQIRA